MINKIDVLHYRILSNFIFSAKMLIRRIHECNCEHCEEAHVLERCPCGSERISPLITGNGETEVLPSGALCCGRCGVRLYTNEMLKELMRLGEVLGIEVDLTELRRLQKS